MEFQGGTIPPFPYVYRKKTLVLCRTIPCGSLMPDNARVLIIVSAVQL